MFNFQTKKADSQEDLSMYKEEYKNQKNSSSGIGAGYAATQAAYKVTQQASKTFAKPETYTGNRNLYDSGSAKVNAKKNLFQSGEMVIDPYTGDELFLTKAEAKMLYGEEWTRHLAESDHVKPLEQIYNDTRGNVWNTTDDIKSAANSKDNLRVVSRKFNNAKRSRTNRECVEGEEKLKGKGVEFTEEGKRQAIKDEEFAETSINRQLQSSAVDNMIKTGHEAGKKAAESSGITALTMSGIMNMVAVIKGEKTSREAITDTVNDGAKATITGYIMGGSLTIVSHSLSNSISQFVRGLAESNVPGKIVTAVAVTGEVLKEWGEGEITMQECLIELGDKGLNMATMGYSMAVGQTLIPIPIIGGAIGALVGSILTSSFYNSLINTLRIKEFEHQERLWIIEESRVAAEQTKAFRMELEIYLNKYFQEYRECFDSALSSMRFAYCSGDADGIIAGANQITEKLGGQVFYETVEECKKFLDDDSIDIL